MNSNPIRILHLIASNFVGGPEKQILHHAKDIQECGFEVWIGSFRDQPDRAEILGHAEQQGLRTCEFICGGRFDPGPIWQLSAFLRRERIDLVCTHGYKANTFGVFAKMLAGVPQIAFCRGWTAETKFIRIFEALDRKLLRFADHVVCVSNAQAQTLAGVRGVGSNVSVVQNAMLGETQTDPATNRETCKAQLGFPADTRLVGAVGRLSIEKGQRYLVQASAELAREFKTLKVVLLGEGRERANLEKQAQQLGLENVLLMPGFQKDVTRWMGAFDVLVNCSLTEGLPNVVLEALALGTPVVATAVGGVPELIEDQVHGLLVSPGDSRALAQGVSRLLSDPQLACELSEKGQLRVKADFSPSRQRDGLLAIYKQVLGTAVGSQDLPRTWASNAGAVRQTACARAQTLPSKSEVLPFISVVIPVRNEEKHLGAVLDGLLTQDYPAERYEILVSDGNSTDKTLDIVEHAARNSKTSIRHCPNPKQRSSAGRNAGVRASSGELIVFIDGHCHVPDTQLLLNTAHYFESTRADCLCRPQPLTAPGSDWFQKAAADVRASMLGHGVDSSIFSSTAERFIDPTSSGASYRRNVFDSVGWYDENFDACEDVEFNYRVLRAGLRSYISPKLTVQYHARSSISGLWKQMVRYGRGRYRFAEKHPPAFSMAQALPASLWLWLVAGSVGSAISGRIAQFFLWSAGVYATIVIASSIGLGLRRGWRCAITAPVLYLTIHFGLGYGFLAQAFDALRGRRRRGVVPDDRTVREQTFPASTNLRYQVVEAAPGVPARTKQVNSGAAAKPQRLNAFSVDVEDYFHTEAMSAVVPKERWNDMPSRVQDRTLRVFEILAHHQVLGTFFFLGWVAERFPELVREALKLGHEVGCHSFWHRRVYLLSPAEFRADTLRAMRAIEDAGGAAVKGYRAPSFSILHDTTWAIDILGELGFQYDSSAHPIHHDLYDNASAPRHPHRVNGGSIVELPIATTRIGQRNLPIGGGGYLRMFPYGYSRWGLRRLNTEEGMAGIVYMHPWEIDPGQPRLPASRKSRLRQYVGLEGMDRKVNRLLSDFRFAPISKVFEQELQAPPAASKPVDSFEALGDESEPEVSRIPNPVGPTGGR